MTNPLVGGYILIVKLYELGLPEGPLGGSINQVQNNRKMSTKTEKVANWSTYCWDLGQKGHHLPKSVSIDTNFLPNTQIFTQPLGQKGRKETPFRA